MTRLSTSTPPRGPGAPSGSVGTDERPPRFSLFALGFRPFFLLAAIAAIAAMVLWTAAYHGAWRPRYYDPVGWHSHEMLFGYTIAVVAGFLLTAVRNWTGVATARGGWLAALAAVWLAGRLLPLLPGTGYAGLIATVDMAFLPMLAVAIGVPLVRAGKRTNLVFLVLLLLLFTANALIHLQYLGITTATARPGVALALGTIALLITVIGGRVIPFFTERALPDAAVTRRMTVERIAIGSVAAAIVADGLVPNSALAAALAVVVALSHGVRLAGWYSARVWTQPLLWILYLGYAWLIAGFALKGLAFTGAAPTPSAIHALTAGSIGALTLGMMARVALGHTGRPLAPHRAMTWAFLLVNLAALTRVALPWLAPQWTAHAATVSGVMWGGAFTVFAAVYTPILCAPRADGRPG